MECRRELFSFMSIYFLNDILTESVLIHHYLSIPGSTELKRSRNIR